MTLPRPLGRDTRQTVRHFDKLVAKIPSAPRSFGGARVPRRSPDLRRFHHQIFSDQAERGFCVGFNSNSVVMTLLRIPPVITDAAAPLPAVRLSALYMYDISRQQALLDGIELGPGDGSIASCAARGAMRWGVVPNDDEPEGPDEVAGHPNDSPPPARALDYGARHLVAAIALAESWEVGLELNAGGRPLALASDIPSGMMDTSPLGIFRMDGAIVGGHCYMLLDHDLDADLALVGQCWSGWGEFFPLSPAYQDARRGYSQIGACSLTDLAKFFTPRLMASGASEIVCFSRVDGFDPLLEAHF